MADILDFPSKACSLTPDHLQQTIAWEEWQEAVIILKRGAESMVLTAASNFETVNYLIDMAKQSIWEGRFIEKHEQ